MSGSVLGGVKSTQKLTINSVYYNPIYDFNKYSFITNAKSFDVSSNTLVRQDLDEDQFLSKTVSPIEFHELKNITRQVKFITSYQYSKKVGKNLNLPEFVDVVFINPNIGHAGNDLDNVPYNFKKLYTIGVDLWQEEQERIKIENHIKGNPSSKKRLKDNTHLTVHYFIYGNSCSLLRKK